MLNQKILHFCSSTPPPPSFHTCYFSHDVLELVMENINQIPTLQPVLTPEPVKNSNVFKYLFFVSIIVLLGVIVGFYYVLNNKISKLSEEKTTEVANQITVEPTAKPTISQDSTLSSLDINNNLYTNSKFGFSLIIPKTINGPICEKSEDSYGIGGSEKRNLTFFENEDTVYLTGNYFYKVTGGETTSKGNYIYTGCQKETVTLQNFSQKYNTEITPVLKIYATNVNGDNEIEQFIKSKYGSGCRLGEKTQSNTPGIFDLKILSDGKGLDESTCPINFAIKTKYEQTKGKLVIFELGQSCNLMKNTSGNCYDLDVVNSLKFN